MRHSIPAFALLLLASPLAAQQGGLASDSPAPVADRQPAASSAVAPAAATAGADVSAPLQSSAPVQALPGSSDPVVTAVPSTVSSSELPSVVIAPAPSASTAAAPVSGAAVAPVRAVPMQTEQ